MFWAYKLSFDVDILVQFGLATVLATFQRIGLFSPKFSGRTERILPVVVTGGGGGSSLVHNFSSQTPNFPSTISPFSSTSVAHHLVFILFWFILVSIFFIRGAQKLAGIW